MQDEVQVKWAGVLYLAFLGILMIREARSLDLESVKSECVKNTSGSMSVGFSTGLLNPKAIVFYMAFLAQFVNSDDDQLSQFFILMITSSIVVAVVLSGYALLALRARNTLQSVRARRRMGYASGGSLLGGSLIMAGAR